MNRQPGIIKFHLMAQLLQALLAKESKRHCNRYFMMINDSYVLRDSQKKSLNSSAVILVRSRFSQPAGYQTPYQYQQF